MRIEVRLFGEFRETVGKTVVVLDLPTDADCEQALQALARCEPKLKELLFSISGLRDHLHVFVNGQNVSHREGLRTKLADGDVLTFFSPISGG